MSLFSLEAIIDCGRGEVLLSEYSICECAPLLDRRLYTMDNYVISPHAAAVITVHAHFPRDDTLLLEPNRNALLQNEVALSRSLVTLRRGETDVFDVNVSHNLQFLPRGMCMASFDILPLPSEDCDLCATASIYSSGASLAQSSFVGKFGPIIDPS